MMDRAKWIAPATSMTAASKPAGGGKTWDPITIAAVRRASRNSAAGNWSVNRIHTAAWARVDRTPAATPDPIAALSLIVMGLS